MSRLFKKILKKLFKSSFTYKHLKKEVLGMVKRHTADTVSIVFPPKYEAVCEAFTNKLKDDLKDLNLKIDGHVNDLIETDEVIVMVKNNSIQPEFVYAPYAPTYVSSPDKKIETTSDLFLKRLSREFGIKESENENS
jgi:hypothetical protein